jgi:hypothetical protein
MTTPFFENAVAVIQARLIASRATFAFLAFLAVFLTRASAVPGKLSVAKQQS